MLICLSCYSIYQYYKLAPVNRGWVLHDCPKLDCGGGVVEIDELMSPTIIILNKKGYKTEFCCSSHWYEDGENTSAYIKFKRKYDFKFLPPGFSLEDDKPYHNTIRKEFPKFFKDEYMNLFHFGLQTAHDLCKWALQLPDLTTYTEKEDLENE